MIGSPASVRLSSLGLAGAVAIASAVFLRPQPQAAAAEQLAPIPALCATLLATGRPVFPLDEEMERPWFDISRYERFPEEDRALLQRSDVENARCTAGHNPEAMRACNRRDCVNFALEDRGWCWGGGDVAADDQWVRCSELPDDPPLTREIFYPEEEIRREFPPNAEPLDVAFSRVEGQFFGRGDSALPAAHPLARLRSDMRARLQRCHDDDCRRQVETDLLHRLLFAIGDADGPVTGFPLQTGRLFIDGKRLSRNLDILPLGDRRIVVNVSTAPDEFARTRCRGMVAEGRLDEAGVARLTSIDDPRIGFVLQVLDPTRVELRSLDGGVQSLPLCGRTASIFGEYRVPTPWPS